MPRELKISIGQHSDKGRKEINQDFHGALIPKEPLLSLKGIAIVLADGISSSNVSQIASESAVKGFLTDYYCTSDAWSVKTSAQRVIAATNSWLHAQTRRSQLCLRQGQGLCLHAQRHGHQSDGRAYLSRRRFPDLSRGRQCARATDRRSSRRRLVGAELSRPRARASIRRSRSTTACSRSKKGMCSCWRPMASTSMSAPRFVANAIKTGAGDLDAAAKLIVEEAYRHGSADNLTVQIVRIDELPDGEASELFGQASELPLPPLLEARMEIRRLQDRPGGSRQQPQPHLSGGRYRERCAGRSSRSRRSTCAATPPISSGS